VPGSEVPRVQVDDAQSLGEMLFDLVRLELRVIDQLATVALRNADRLLTSLQRSGEPRRPEPPEPEPVRLAGRRGTSTRTRFIVDNPSLRDAELRLRASDFAPEGGGAPFPGEVAIRPETVRLAPRQEIEIEVDIRVDDRFEPGRRYRAEIEVHAAGRPRRALPIAVDVESEAPPPSPPEAPPEPVPRKRPRRKKA
jgi:hypothetical protein